MKEFNKLNFISYPTPFYEMKNLRRELGVKERLFIKRDDLTEVGLGGNKNRKLDLVMAEAAASGATAVVTWGGLQSNHCRQTLAYAVKLGMECHLVLNGEKPKTCQGNLLIYGIMGASLYYEPEESRCMDYCVEIAEKLAKSGKTPFTIPIGASSALGAAAYAGCAGEIARQAAQNGITAAHIFCATGSAGTQAGLEIGSRLYIPGCTIHGVSVGRPADAQAEKVAVLANETAALMCEDMKFEPGEICVHGEYYGEGYAVPTKGGIDAINLLGRTEAVVLDPVYTGKAMHCMLDMLRAGELKGDIIFLHTGGSPANFHYAECFYTNS